MMIARCNDTLGSGTSESQSCEHGVNHGVVPARVGPWASVVHVEPNAAGDECPTPNPGLCGGECRLVSCEVATPSRDHGTIPFPRKVLRDVQPLLSGELPGFVVESRDAELGACKRKPNPHVVRPVLDGPTGREFDIHAEVWKTSAMRTKMPDRYLTREGELIA